MSADDYVIHFILTNRTIQQQIQLQPLNSLIQLNTEQICKQIRDIECVSANHDLKIQLAQATKDSFSNWIINGKVQSFSLKPLNQLTVIVNLYDSAGNIVGLERESTTPSNLNQMDTAVFNLIDRPTGVPKFFRISFEFVS